MKTNRFTGMIVGLLIIASPAIGQVNLYKAEFNTDGDLEGWADVGDLMKEFAWNGTTNTGEEEVSGGAFRAQNPDGLDAKMRVTGLSIDEDTAKDLVVRMRQTKDNGVTWDPAGNMSGILAVVNSLAGGTPAFVVFSGTEIIQTADETLPGDGWTLLTIPLKGGGGDEITGDINDIRFDPSQFVAGESFEIDYIRVTAVDNPPGPVAELDPTSPISGNFILDRDWDWDVDGDLDDWTTANFTASVNGSVVTGTSTSGDPNFNSANNLSIAVPTSGEMIMEIGVVGTGTAPGTGEFFWRDSNGPFATARRVVTPSIPADTADHVIRINFNGDIAGILDRIRYDPSVGTTGIVSKIDYVRVYVDQDFIWDGGGADSNFSTSANWVGDVAPANIANKNFRFGPLTGPQQATANVDLPGNSDRVYFFKDAAAMTVTGNFFQLGANGVETGIANYSPNLQTFGNEVRQFWIGGSTNRTWDAVDANGTLEFNSVTLRGDNAPTALTWTLAGSGTGRITSDVVDATAWSGKAVELIKSGTGTWDLQGALSGVIEDVSVNEGTLLLGGTSTATVGVASGAILGGNGTVGGALTVDAGGVIAPGTSVGTLTAGVGATIDGTLEVEIDGATIDLLAVNGTLDVSNATIDFQVIGAAPTESSYTIASATVAVTGTPATTNVPADYEVNVGANAITLDATAAGTAFETWAAGGELFGDDANGDGVEDGIAFLLGAATPNDDAAGLLPAASEDGSGGLVMSFTMLKPVNSAPAALSLSHSGDLGVTDAWSTPVAIPAATGTAGGVSFTVTENTGDPGKNDVVATIPSSGNSIGGKLFGRLEGVE